MKAKNTGSGVTNFENFLTGLNSNLTPLTCLAFYYDILQNNFHYVTLRKKNFLSFFEMQVQNIITVALIRRKKPKVT